MATVTAAATLAPTPLSGRRIAFTTPESYAARLSHLLLLRGAAPLPVPTLTITPTPQNLAPYLLPSALDPFSALAFTSRNGITSFTLSLPLSTTPPLSNTGDPFIIAALGRDADLLRNPTLLSNLCSNPVRIRILAPHTPSPAGLVESLGPGLGRAVLCPVPIVIDLEEPPVVPDFIRDLTAAGWDPVRVAAYETRWAGPGCVRGLVELEGGLDAVVFTSTAEVEGMLKGLEELGWEWRGVRERWPEMVVAAHGPVTAKGAERFGVEIDVVSERFGSFDGVVDALGARWGVSDVDR